VEVRRDIHDRYNFDIQSAMVGTVWMGSCNNYYRHRSGKAVTQFPYSGRVFADLLRTPNLADYHLTPAATGTTLTAL